jgi:hypothetical protein
MNKYLATVRIEGKSVKTIVFADNPLHALLILEYKFGIGNVVINPILSTNANEDYTPLEEVIASIKPVGPMTPAKARIYSLKRTKDAAAKNLKAERDRQKVTRAQHQIASVTSSIPKI